MKRGFIKGSRTLDLKFVDTILSTCLLGFMYYTPEQYGITVPVYAAIRGTLIVFGVILRYKTTTAVGEKKE